MDSDQLGTGYFRVRLPHQLDAEVIERIYETARSVLAEPVERLNMLERFEPPRPFWEIYEDCVPENAELETDEQTPVVYCNRGDATYLRHLLRAYRKATAEMAGPSGSDVDSAALPGLVNAHLRAEVPRKELETAAYAKVQDKDLSRHVGEAAGA